MKMIMFLAVALAAALCVGALPAPSDDLETAEQHHRGGGDFGHHGQGGFGGGYGGGGHNGGGGHGGFGGGHGGGGHGGGGHGGGGHIHGYGR